MIRLKRVTIPDEEFISSEGIDVARIQAYGGMESVPEPVYLRTPGYAFEVRSFWTPPEAVVDRVKVGDEWQTL